MNGTGQTVDFAAGIGSCLRQLREASTLTQADLSARLQAAGLSKGSSPKTISAWERGETPLPLVVLPLLAAAFRMKPEELTRQLGLCGGSREIRAATMRDLMGQLEDEPPEVVDGVLQMVRLHLTMRRRPGSLGDAPGAN